MTRFTLRHYCTPEGVDLYQQWLLRLRDRQARARVLVRTNRLAEAGQFGDCKPVGGGVWELRIDHGPGYRVYYARAGEALVLLLIGGDKSTQQADIATAHRCWQDWKRRSGHDEDEDRPTPR